MKRPTKERALCVTIALVLIFGSAYAAARLILNASLVGAWTGLQQHDTQIRSLRAQAILWEVLAVLLPFLAAAFLAFGKRSVNSGVAGTLSSGHGAELRSSLWAASPVMRYFICVIISLAGVLGSLLALALIGFALSRM